MISENINTTTMIIVGIILVLIVATFSVMALLNGNNTVTLEDSVRTALIDNRDDSARVNSNTLYPLNVRDFERQVRGTKLQEVKGKTLNPGTEFKFYYLLQDGNLYDSKTYQKKLANGSNRLNRTGRPTLIKAVTVDAVIDTQDLSVHHGKFADEKALKSAPGTRRYSITYVVDGGVVKHADDRYDEASRILPKDYQRAKQQEAHDEKYGFKPNTMVNLTDN